MPHIRLLLADVGCNARAPCGLLWQLWEFSEYNPPVRGSLLFYAGVIIGLLALVCLIKPFGFLGINSRLRALILLAIAAFFIVVAFALPIREYRVFPLKSALDRFAPIYQFSEFHSIEIDASPPQVYRAINEVSADEITLFRTLVWIRRGGRSGRESILNPTPGTPILQVAMRTGFVLLADDPNHEIALGAFVLAPPGFRLGRKVEPVDFINIRQPGFAMATMNFEIAEVASGRSALTTETRIYATDPPAARKFHRYWSIVYPGSSIIRYSWLRAIKRRAEGK